MVKKGGTNLELGTLLLELLLGALEDGDGVLRLLEIDDEHLDLGLQTALSLLKLADLLQHDLDLLLVLSLLLHHLLAEVFNFLVMKGNLDRVGIVTVSEAALKEIACRWLTSASNLLFH